MHFFYFIFTLLPEFLKSENVRARFLYYDGQFERICVKPYDSYETHRNLHACDCDDMDRTNALRTATEAGQRRAESFS